MRTTTTPATSPSPTRSRPAAVLGVLPALLVLLLSLAGCGSDDPTASDPTPGTGGSTSASVPPVEPSTGAASSDGSSDAPSDPASSSAPAVPAGTPACDQVWRAGATIPQRYRGCAEDGALVEADRLGCESGQAIIRYADHFYGVAGGTVHRTRTSLLQDADYNDTVAGCRA